MKSVIQSSFNFATLALFFVLAGVTVISAQETVTNVPSGQQIKVLGVITARGAYSFKMITLDYSKTYSVVVTPGTSIKSNTRGVFRGGKNYELNNLLRGLRVEVKGIGHATGEIAADSIRFNETDLRTAQSIQSRLSPVEEQIAANTGNIATNTENIEDHTERIAAAEENQGRMSGQIEETQGLVAQAQAAADRANTRISGLDEFDLVKSITVPFASGSSTIDPTGKQIIDEAAAWVKTQNTKGWMVAVVGFADVTGNNAANRILSERRAKAVIEYLVSKYNLPMHRLVQPFGAGADQPVASNDTASGRAQNRRAEIRFLVNKGIAER